MYHVSARAHPPPTKKIASYGWMYTCLRSNFLGHTVAEFDFVKNIFASQIYFASPIYFVIWNLLILSTYQAGIPTQSSSQATIVGPFHNAKGVPAFMASSSNSCLWVKLKWNKKTHYYTLITHANDKSLDLTNLTFSSSAGQSLLCPQGLRDPPYYRIEPFPVLLDNCNPDVDSLTKELSRNLQILFWDFCLSSRISFQGMTSSLSSLLQRLLQQLFLVLHEVVLHEGNPGKHNKWINGLNNWKWKQVLQNFHL